MPEVTDPLAEYRHRIPELTQEALDNIPDDLKSPSQWVAWRLEYRAGKVTKVPIDPMNGNLASATDPGTWGTFAQAVKGLVRYSCDGIGFVFTADDPFCGIDLDSVNGKDDLANLLEVIDSYAEKSPSGRGIHIISKAELPNGRGRRRKGFEIYDRRRYFTVTGEPIEGTPSTIEARQAEITKLLKQMFGPDGQRSAKKEPKTAHGSSGIGDEEVLTRCRSVASSAVFSQLYDEGDIEEYTSHSEADLALCSFLAHWTCDAEQIDRLFRDSSLIREKWEKRADYRQGTIQKVLGEKAEEDDDPANQQSGGLASHKPLLNPADPLPSARQFISARFDHGGHRTLVFQQGDFYRWDGITFRQADDDEMEQDTYHFLEGAVRRNKWARIVPFMPNRHKVAEVLAALKMEVLLARKFAPPCWISASHALPADEIIVCSNGLLHLPTQQLQAHSRCFSRRMLALSPMIRRPGPRSGAAFLGRSGRRTGRVLKRSRRSSGTSSRQTPASRRCS